MTHSEIWKTLDEIEAKLMRVLLNRLKRLEEARADVVSANELLAHELSADMVASKEEMHNAVMENKWLRDELASMTERAKAAEDAASVALCERDGVRDENARLKGEVDAARGGKDIFEAEMDRATAACNNAMIENLRLEDKLSLANQTITNLRMRLSQAQDMRHIEERGFGE